MHKSLPRSAFLILGLGLGAFPVQAAAQCELARFEADPPVIHDVFGYSITVEDGLAVAGAPAHGDSQHLPGAAHVYFRGREGWELAQVLLDPEGSTSNTFGTAVALSDDVLLVSNPDAVQAGSVRGAVHVFQRTGPRFIFDQTIRLPAGSADAPFGASLSLEAGVALVRTGNGAGATLNLFERRGSDWLLAREFSVDEVLPHLQTPLPPNSFGISHAVTPDRVVLTLDFLDSYSQPCGKFTALLFPAVAIYERRGSDWVLDTVLEDFMDSSVRFGFLEVRFPIALENDLLALGNPASTRFGCDRGAVHLYEQSGSAWVPIEVLGGEESATGRGFGLGLDLDAGRLFVTRGSAWGDAALFAYERDGFGWEPVAEVDPSLSTPPYDRFGWEVAADQGEIWIGSPFQPSRSHEPGRGYAFSFPGSVYPLCLCENEGCAGGPGSAGCTNSSGAGASLHACGTTRVDLDDLLLKLAGLPREQVAVLMMGARARPYSFGAGTGCVSDRGSGLYYFPPRSTGLGELELGPGLVAESYALFPPEGRIVAGSTWTFQLAYTDRDMACRSQRNTSNAVEISFAP